MSIVLLKTPEQLRQIIAARLEEHVAQLRLAVSQVGGTATIEQDWPSLEKSWLGSRLLSLVEYLERSRISEEEKQKSRETLHEVLVALYGRPFLYPHEAATEFGELCDAVRVKGTKLPEVLNINETLQYLNEHAGRKYYLRDIYSFIDTGRLWPISVAITESKKKRRYERTEVAALAEQLRAEQERERQEED
jgi:hypothetical protein